MRDVIQIINDEGIITPWSVCAVAPNPQWRTGQTIHGHGKRVADVAPLFMPDVECVVADLIAAAPDLYKALNDLIEDFSDAEGELIDNAKAVLAKARGEQL